MILFRAPTNAAIADYVARQAEQPLSYDFAGETQREVRPRRGWNIDGERVLLGHGEAVFRLAQTAIDRWRMFPPAVTTVHASGPPATGLDAAVLYWAAPLRLWMLFPVRVIYRIHEVDWTNGCD